MEKICNLLIWVLKEGSPDEIEQYADVIRSHIPVDKFLRYLQIDEEQIKNQFEVREATKEQTLPTTDEEPDRS